MNFHFFQKKQRGGIKSWALFTVLIVLFFGVLFNLQKIKEGVSPSLVEQEAQEKKGKSFATAALTEEEQKKLDQEQLHQAWRQESAGSCETIADETLKSQCLDALNFARFSKGNNERLCESLFDPRLRSDCFNQIFLRVALQEMNGALCQKIESAALKQQCLDQVQSLLGGKTKNLSSCDSIDNPTLKNQCINSVRFSASVDQLNIEGCDSISSEGLRERCRATVTQNQEVIKLNEQASLSPYKKREEVLEDCATLQGNASAYCQNEAHFSLALEKKDLKYCQAITDESRRNECMSLQGSHINRFYLKQAIAKKEPALCQKIIDETLRSTCLSYIK